MTEEQRERIRCRLRERIEQMPDGPDRNRLHYIRMRLYLEASPRSIHETLSGSGDGER